MKSLFSRLFRLILAFTIIYVSLVAYMMLSERRFAFPRADLDESAAQSLESSAVTCRTSDGKLLQGWILNGSAPETVLYFADRGEDVSTFLSNAKKIPGYRFVGFNVRGSGGSEGSPAEKFYEEDLRAMIGCSDNGRTPIFLGHGTGAIAAFNSLVKGYGKSAILIDPVESFAEAISSRYGIFFPEFLVRTKIAMDFSKNRSKATVILDDPLRKASAEKLLEAHPENFQEIKRGGASLLKLLETVLMLESRTN